MSRSARGLMKESNRNSWQASQNLTRSLILLVIYIIYYPLTLFQQQQASGDYYSWRLPFYYSTTMTTVKSDPDGVNYAVVLTEMRDIQSRILRNEDKLKLLQDLRKKGLFTRDILSFDKTQTELRSYNKSIDMSTAT